MEAIKLELEKYLEIAVSRADNEMKNLRSKANKRHRETDKRLLHISEDGKLFQELIDDNSSAMDKYSQKIAERIEETVGSINKPDKFTFKNLENYTNIIRSTFLEQDEILIRYIRMLKGVKFKKRIKSLDKSLKKLDVDLKKLEKFIREDYGPSAEIEKTANIIKETIKLIDKFEDVYATLLDKKELIIEKDNQLIKLKKKFIELENHPEKIKYQNSVNDYTETQKQIDNYFSNIRKALRKYENIANKSKEKFDTTLLRELVKDAANCLARQSNLGNIENLLIIIQQQLNATALQLKKEKREATKDDIARLLNGDLQKYWEKSQKVAKNKENCYNELLKLDLNSKISKIKITLEAFKRDRNRIMERELRDVEKLKSEIEKQIDDIINRLSTSSNNKIPLEVKIPEIPEWSIII